MLFSANSFCEIISRSKPLFPQLLGTLLIVSASPVYSQAPQRTIEATEGEAWHHKFSGAAMPAKLGGFDRKYIRDLTNKELDVFAQYHGDTSQSRLTLFFYRAAIDNVPLWFDTANQSLRTNSGFLPEVNGFVSATFVPPGQSSESGMMAIYETSGNDFKSTGVAMVPMNGWLVKIRFSSVELNAVEMAAALLPIMGTVKWPDNIDSGPRAVAIQPCDDELELTDKVQRIQPGIADALIGGLSSAAVDSDGTDKTGEPVVYCRDPQDWGRFPIYRANGSKTGYVLPLGDAGRALSIFQNVLGGLVGGSDGARYTPSNMQLDTTTVYPDLNKLPTPDLLLAAVDDDVAISSTTTWPKGDSTVTIGVPAEENE